MKHSILASAIGLAMVSTAVQAAQWQQGATYSGGEVVTQDGTDYQCKPFPFSGWCGLSAYQPGVGFAWSDAWQQIGAQASPTLVPTPTIVVTPTVPTTVTPTVTPSAIPTPTTTPTATANDCPTFIAGQTRAKNGETYLFNGSAWKAKNNPGPWETPREGWFWTKSDCLIQSTPTVTPAASVTPSITPTASPTAMITTIITPTLIPSQTPGFYGTMPNGEPEQLQQQALTIANQWLDRYLTSVQAANEPQLFIDYAKVERRESWMTDKQAVSVSEGHGYGMLVLTAVAAQGARATAKSEFDAMVNFWLAHPSFAGTKLMAWQQWDLGLNAQTGAGIAGAGQIIDRPGGEANSATDGDLDMAYALIIANQLWPNEGYDSAAKLLLDDIRQTIVMPDGSLRLGDWAATVSKFKQTTRPSDFLIQHLREFAKFDSSYAGVWHNSADRMIAHVEANTNLTMPLLPDFGIVNANGEMSVAPAFHLESEYDAHYYYNSARQPWRIAMPGIYNQTSSLDDNIEWINDFFIQASNGDPNKVFPGVWISGEKQGQWIVTDYTDLTFTAPLLVSAVADDRTGITPWRNALWQKLTSQHPVESEFYFGSSIRVLSLLTAVDLWPTLDE